MNTATTHFDVIEAMRFLLDTFSARDKPGAVGEMTRALQRVFDVTPNIRLAISLHGGHAVIYRGGAGLLDEAVIESNLTFLQAYPKVLKPFETALTMYSSKEVNQQRNMLDNLWFALEEMIRTVLKNEKSLENQKEPLLAWLRAKGAHVQIINMYFDIQARFAQYQNDAVKHKEDQYTPAEIEFILYLVGTFLRFIQRVAAG